MQPVRPIARVTRRPIHAWRHVFALIFATAFLAACAEAGVEFGIADVEEKGIRAETPDSEPLRVSLEPVKTSFKVDEPIRFNVRGNKTFFLYLYSIDNETDAVTLLLPTREGQRHNKYPANRVVPVPNRGEIELLADAPGRERLLMVASTKYLPVESKWYRRGADFYVGKTADLEQDWAGKGIHVRGPNKTRDQKVLVKTVMVQIDSDSPPVPASHVWLTTSGNRQDYALGDPIEAVFGAGQDGWIHLYVVEPNGQYNRLRSYAVEENQAYRAKGIAADPAGKHALVAVYSEDDKPLAQLATSTERGLSLLDDAASKGVELVDDEPALMAVYRFRISDR
ncbi:MAG: DUF4384 domain-containing protein [Candidatus Tectomicrobia bacterium]|nr:DUF4384 domain-containing protein [Candidatus Tectomicrobia bacterium]